MTDLHQTLLDWVALDSEPYGTGFTRARINRADDGNLRGSRSHETRGGPASPVQNRVARGQVRLQHVERRPA